MEPEAPQWSPVCPPALRVPPPVWHTTPHAPGLRPRDAAPELSSALGACRPEPTWQPGMMMARWQAQHLQPAHQWLWSVLLYFEGVKVGVMEVPVKQCQLVRACWIAYNVLYKVITPWFCQTILLYVDCSYCEVMSRIEVACSPRRL